MLTIFIFISNECHRNILMTDAIHMVSFLSIFCSILFQKNYQKKEIHHNVRNKSLKETEMLSRELVCFKSVILPSDLCVLAQEYKSVKLCTVRKILSQGANSNTSLKLFDGFSLSICSSNLYWAWYACNIIWYNFISYHLWKLMPFCMS